MALPNVEKIEQMKALLEEIAVEIAECKRILRGEKALKESLRQVECTTEV